MRALYITLLALFAFFAAIAQQKPVSCGTSDDALPEHVLRKMADLPAILQKQKARIGSGEMNICRIAVEVDYQTYVNFEKDTNVIYQKVLDDIEKVSIVYQKEINTRMVVTNIRIFKDPDTDPFAVSDNIFTLLSILTNLAPATNDFDKRAYFYTKLVSGNASGVAYIGGVTSVSRLGNPQLMMHEFGHNFASPHTHNCSWPGGPIDFCSSPEGGCYDKALEMLTDRSGTIMSYCIWEPTFHPLCQAIMRDHADNAFSKIHTSPEAPKLRANDQVSKGDFLIWPAVANALSYEVSYASNPDFSDSKTVSVPFNGYSLKGVPTGTTIFVRIKAINTFGSSSWSDAVNVKINLQQVSPPEIASPETSPIVPRGDLVPLSYSEVPGATGYEIQIAYNSDISFDYPFFNTVASTTTFQYNAEYPMAVKWRVRAISDQGKGQWSETGYFSINLSLGYQLSVPFTESTLTSFPFSYSPLIPYSRIKVSVADNHSFDNALFAKEYSSYGEIIDVVPNLPANSQLYFRIEEWNQNEFNFPLKKIADYTAPFKTGNMALPDNLTFLSGLNPKVFDRSYPPIALTAENLWLSSQNSGFARVNTKDLSHQVFNRKNTDGQIGYSALSPALRTDDSLNLHIMSLETGFSYRRLKLANDTPDKNGLVKKLNFTGFFLDYSPSHNIYWDSKTLYKEANLTLVPFKTLDDGWNIQKILSAAGKIWILAGNNGGRAELIVLDPASGAEIERINANTQPELLPHTQDFVVANDGRVMVLQYDLATFGYRLALRDNQKWSIQYSRLPPFFSNSIQAIACSPAGAFYAMTADEQIRVFKYGTSGWKKLGADIPLRIFSNSIVPDQHDNIWLSGNYGVARLAVSQLDLVSTNKADYCANDSITVTMNIGDKVNTDNPFTISLKKANGETETVSNLFAIGDKIRFIIPSEFTGADVELRVKSAGPEISSGNALRLTIRGLPAAKLFVTKSVMIPLVDTTTFSVELTGEQPWAFKLWNGDSISTEVPTYSRPFILQDTLGITLSISGLRDKYCTGGTISNSIQIQPNLITGVSEPSLLRAKVYPNPSADKILLELEQPTGKPSVYHIADSKGIIVDSMQVREKLTEWDISKLSAGIYILWTVQQGSKRSWKFVKN